MAFGSYDEALVILNRIVTHLIDDSRLDHARKSERLHALNGAIEAIQSEHLTDWEPDADEHI